VVDLSGFEYDPVRQVGVICEGDVAVPLLRHTTGKTSTQTSDGHKSMDSDSDQRADD
jgi:putative ATP-grasp target RiPP